MHRESSPAVSLWMTSIVAPQLGQCQLEVVSEEVEGGGRSLASSCWQSGRQCARNRFARKPKYRILTKPLGSTCRKKRRKNSVPSSVIVRCLPP